MAFPGARSTISQQASDYEITHPHFLHPLSTVTHDITKYEILLNTRQGQQIKIECWDTLGQEKTEAFNPTGQLKGKKIEGAIILFDFTAFNSTASTVEELYARIHQIVPDNKDIPVVLCGNKVDTFIIKSKEVPKKFEKSLNGIFQRTGMQYYHMSVKTAHNITMPFLYLASKLTNVEFQPDESGRANSFSELCSKQLVNRLIAIEEKFSEDDVTSLKASEEKIKKKEKINQSADVEMKDA